MKIIEYHLFFLQHMDAISFAVNLGLLQIV